MLSVAPALPLVILPGAGGRLDVLKPIGERLARRRTTILCGYPGIGHAAPDSSLQSLADLQAHVLEGLPERFDLVAKSMGGVLALRTALEQPQRVRKLVLLATSGGVNVAALGGIDWRDTFRRLQPDAPSWFIEERSDLSAELGRVKQPTLLIFGEADLIAPVRVGHFLKAKLPNARLELVPDGTHDLEEEFPDLIASLIEAHLRRPEPSD
jgi:pimeloyl-ACP methyl ester carboxylesterase